MVIKNISKNSLISTKAKLAQSFLDRLLGLLNPHNPPFLIFKTRYGIHTFFMKHPIDVLLLDSHLRVIKLKECLKPFRVFLYHPKYSHVLEMPKGTIQKKHIHINDKISIE